ncbi:MAG TPA: aldehyde dehydrogenase family protein [Pseudonocardiaceae bacterium]
MSGIDVHAVNTKPRPCWIAGRPEQGSDELVVHHPYDGTDVATVAVPGPDQVERAVAAAAAVAGELRRLPAHVRAAALDHVSRRLAERVDEIAELITAENGKPLRWATAEVRRACSTFRFAAEEARRFGGDLQRLDTDPTAEGRMALVRRVPRGPVLGITPFNFPLNLAAHKVAPALAVGAPIVLKPAPRTPLSALLLGELLAETDLPEGAFSVLPLPGTPEGNERTMALVRDERLPVVSFTGSGPVGWAIADAAPRKHVVLELGGNAAAVVCADWNTDADLDFAAQRIATFSNYQAGQSCIAVQRVIVDRAVADSFVPRLVAAVRGLRTGNPHDPEVEVGPLVDEAAARRVEEWIEEAVGRGATVLTGGTRRGSTIAPTVLTDVPTDTRVWCEEIFGPVLAVSVVDGVDEAFAQVNDSAYGLQAGVFTHDVRVAFRAAAELEVGGVIVGDVPSYRADQMPYGGTKGSGIGREGVRSAMTDLTEERVLVLTGIPV